MSSSQQVGFRSAVALVVDDDTLAEQRRAVKRFAYRHHLRRRELRDQPGDDSRVSTRHGFRALWSAVLRGDKPWVIVPRPEHLARDPVVRALLVAQFEQHGVKVFEAETGRELTGGSGEELLGGHQSVRDFLLQVVRAAADLERELTLLRLWAGRQSASPGGTRSGRPAFGNRNREERKTISRILELYRKARGGVRHSFGAIAEILNAESLPSPTPGVPWSRHSVERVVKRTRSRRKRQ